MPAIKPITITRFWKRVKKTETCWLWVGAKTKINGHGQTHLNSKKILAHRFSWVLHHGAIPDGLFVLHNCPGKDNKACVNPFHLWLGTNKENLRDMVKKGDGRPQYGERNSAAKLTEDEVIAMRNKRQTGALLRELSKEFKISVPVVSQICRRLAWRHVDGV